jgi:hypothetical protein
MTYADGTSGHQGDASEDAEFGRRQRQAQVYGLVMSAGAHGVTWRDVSESLDVHHGVSSSALSNLHLDKHIVKLAERRNGCGIYVLPRYAEGQETIERRHNYREY